jgi:hypothetical protein
MDFVGILGVVMAASILLSVVAGVISLRRDAAARAVLARSRGLTVSNDGARWEGVAHGRAVVVDLEKARPGPRSPTPVVTTSVSLPSRGANALACRPEHVDALMGAFPAIPKQPTGDAAFDAAMTVFGAFPGLADPSTRAALVDLETAWVKRSDGTLEVVCPPLGADDVGRAIDVAASLDEPRAVAPLRRGPRRGPSVRVGVAIFATWLAALLFGIGGAFGLAFTDAARAWLAPELCREHEQLYVSRVSNGARTSYGLYCGKEEGAFRRNAEGAFAICGLAGADVAASVGALVALGLALSKRVAPRG